MTINVSSLERLNFLTTFSSDEVLCISVRTTVLGRQFILILCSMKRLGLYGSLYQNPPVCKEYVKKVSRRQNKYFYLSTLIKIHFLCFKISYFYMKTMINLVTKIQTKNLLSIGKNHA